MTLKNHMKLLLYECPVCGYIYKSKWSMKKHLKKYHKDVSIRDCKRINAKTGEYVETKIEEEEIKKIK